MDNNKALKKVWTYLSVSDKLKKSDVIFVLGRDDFNIADKAIELYKKNFAPMILLTGGRGRLTGSIKGSEAFAFYMYLQNKGIPAENIVLESNSSNTGENILEGLKILNKLNIKIKRIILTTHGPHMRRALATAKEYNNTIEWLATPDSCSLPLNQNYLDAARELVGEINRLDEYPKLGYFSFQNIPTDIFSAKQAIENHLLSQQKT